MKRIKCKVCGKRVKPTKDLLYIAMEKQAAFKAMVEASKAFECIDCPRCSHQIVLGVREGWKEEPDGEEEAEE